MPQPPSPAASAYDVSSASEDEYSSVRARSNTAHGVKLLFAKSKVYMHPTSHARDNVAGYMALLQQKGDSTADILLAWVPEASIRDPREKEAWAAVEMNNVESDEPTRKIYLVERPPVVSAGVGATAFAVPLADIFSVQVRVPSVGWWFGSIIINTRGGSSFPALFFHDSECQSTIAKRKKYQRENFSISDMFWGGDQVIEWLKRYVNVERSAHELSIYLIDPSEQDKLSFGGNTAKPTQDKVRNLLEGRDPEAASNAPRPQNNGLEQVATALKQARWNFLETMAQVTTFTRRTAQAVTENKNLPPQVRRLMQNPQVQTVSDEFDSARIYLARWARSIAEQSDRERTARIWTANDVLQTEDSAVGQFELLDVDAQGLSLADRRTPVTMSEWNGFFNSRNGRLEKTPDEVKERIFHGGCADDSVRKEAWLFLLGVYNWNSTKEERHAHMNSLRDEYVRLKGAWWERMLDGTGTLEEREWWTEQKGRIEKDVHRTDRHLPLFAGEDIPHPDPDSPFADAGTNVHLEQMKDMLLTYNEHNRALGYVQGMSDLLAPLYAVSQDDAVAFWAFTQFMDRMERNFLRDQSGMRLQLLTLDQLVQFLDPKLHAYLATVDSTNFFFFFRMILVWYKREFDFPDILRLWEALWTDYLSSSFHLFIAVAILEKHRNIIMSHLKGFDEVLKYVQELSGSIDLPSTLARAEALFRKFQRMVEAVDRKTSFPAAPAVKQRLPAPEQNAPSPAASASGSSAARPPSSGKKPEAQGKEEKEKVITPELRALLSREVPVLKKEEVREHGGGVGS